jgi:hypothetical protein
VLVEYKLQKNNLGGLPGSRKTLPLTAGLAFGRYDAERQDIRGYGKAKAAPVAKGQEAIEPFRNRAVAKAEGARLFLLELEPDSWVVQGWGNTSFSLGSYRFELAPGTITDLGVVSGEVDWAEGQKAPDLGSVAKAALLGVFAKHPDVAPMRASFRPRGEGDIPVPAGLPAERVQRVTFTPDTKFGNHLGGLVNHVEGVNARLRAAADSAPAQSGTPSS